MQVLGVVVTGYGGEGLLQVGGLAGVVVAHAAERKCVSK